MDLPTAPSVTPPLPRPAVTLGDYLTARRAAVDAGRAGARTSGKRRVAGLRREEVAILAGVSVDYYTRLEQGREIHPSPRVLDALVRALELGDDARLHLYRLAGLVPTVSNGGDARVVTPELRQLLGELRESAALVVTAAWDIAARNDLCEALHRGFRIRDNSARMVFLDPLGRTFYTPWESIAESTVAHLALATGAAPHDARLAEVVDEVAQASADFRQLWDRRVVRSKANSRKHFDHPDLGRLTFSYQSFDVRGMQGQQLVIYGRVAGDTSVARLLAYAGE